MLTVLDPPAEPISAFVERGGLGLALPHLNAAESGVVKRVIRDHDTVDRVDVSRQTDIPFRPQAGEMMPPCLLQALEEQVRTAEQQYLRLGCVALGQGCQVLIDDRLKQAGDDLANRHAAFDQGIGVRFGEDAAFRADLVQAHAVIRHARESVGFDLQLPRSLFDKGAGAAAARGLHVNLLALANARGGQEDCLHILAADLGNEVHLRSQPLHRRGDGHHLLNHLSAHQPTDHAGSGSGQEDSIPCGAQPTIVLHPGQKLEDLFGLFRAMTLVITP